jgi:membrane protein implicated in regulation of membrane protease activity
MTGLKIQHLSQLENCKSAMLGIAGIVTFLDVMLWAGFIVSVTTVDTENLPLPGNAPWSVELIMLLMLTVLSVLCWMLYRTLPGKDPT